MKKVINIFIVLLLLVLSSCDIPGTLTIKNKTEGVLKIRYYSSSNEGSLALPVEEVILSNEKGRNEYQIYFGFGQLWTDDRIKQFIADIEKVEIITSKDSIVIEGEHDLYEYLKKRRKGIFKNQMKITIDK